MLKRLLLCAALALPIPAAAQSTVVCPVGNTVQSLNKDELPSAVQLDVGVSKYRLTFINRYSVVNTTVGCSFTGEDGTIEAIIDHGNGSEPDRMTVKAPPGWHAEPPSVEVEEGEFGEIFVVPDLYS